MPISENMVQEIVQEVMAKMQIADAPTGKHGVFKIRSILAYAAVIVIRAGMGIDISYRFHHGKAVGHVIVFLDDIFQGQNDFFRGGLRGI